MVAHVCFVWVTVCETVRSMPSDRCPVCPVQSCPVGLSVLSACNVGILWPNGRTDQDETCHAGRPRPWPHCVRWGSNSSFSKGAQPYQFLAQVCSGQTAGWIKMPLGMEIGLGPGDCVRWGTSSPSPKRGRAPQFSDHFYCGRTAGCIKMPLGMEVGLGPGHIVLDGDPAPPKKRGHSPQIFGPCLLWQDNSMDQDATWYSGRPRRGASSPSKERGTAPNFWPMCIVAKQLYASGYHLVQK